MRAPTANSAAFCRGSGRKAPKSTIGTPNPNSVVAWPAPQATPSAAACRVPARRPSPATSVETAVRWSGSVAWRSPSRAATTATSRNTSPPASAATRSSIPNISVALSRGLGELDALALGLVRAAAAEVALLDERPQDVHDRAAAELRGHVGDVVGRRDLDD